MLISIVQSLDWPNLVGGALFSAVLGFAVWFLRQTLESWVACKDLPYPLQGVWFSAEFDPKGEVSREDRNTMTKVKVRRGVSGNFTIRVVASILKNQSRPVTAWKFRGKLVHGDTLVGTWRSSIKYTKRFGTAIIKFIDYGRAIGYWNGTAGKDYPVYGYWIMSRVEKDIQILAKAVLDHTQFDFVDVVGYVLEMSPPEQITTTR